MFGGGLAAGLVGVDAQAGATWAGNEATNNAEKNIGKIVQACGQNAFCRALLLTSPLATTLVTAVGAEANRNNGFNNAHDNQPQLPDSPGNNDDDLSGGAQGRRSGGFSVAGMALLSTCIPTPPAGCIPVTIPVPTSFALPSFGPIFSVGDSGSDHSSHDATGASSAGSGKQADSSASSSVKTGGTVELFTDSTGPKVSGAVGVGPTDPRAVAADARNMPNIPSNSQAKVVANNPFIPSDAGGTGAMMDYLPEAARITRPGGEIVVNGNMANMYVKNMPTAAQLEQLGLEVKYQGNLLPEYRGFNFLRTDGSRIDLETMRSVVFVKKGRV